MNRFLSQSSHQPKITLRRATTDHESIQFGEEDSLIRRLDLQSSILRFDVRDIVVHQLPTQSAGSDAKSEEDAR